MSTGAVTLTPGKWSDALEFDGKSLLSVHGPRWRLLIIGAGQLSRYLAQMAQALDYQVTVCDPREESRRSTPIPATDFRASLESYAKYLASGDPSYNQNLTLLTSDCSLRRTDEERTLQEIRDRALVSN